MPVSDATALFKVALSAPQGTALMNLTGKKGAAVQRALLDDQIAFAIGDTHMLIGYEYREFKALYSDIRANTRMNSITVAMESATDRLKQILETRMDDARDNCRGVFDNPAYVEQGTPDIDPDASGKDAADTLLQGANGIAIGREHKDPTQNILVIEMLNADQPVGMLFIEEFAIEIQADIDAYLAGPADMEMSDDLKRRIKEIDGQFHVDWTPLLAKAKEKNVRIYGVDSIKAEPGVESDDPSYGERRVAIMNSITANVMRQAIADNPDAKYVLMCGDAHLNTHIGGVPGLSQMFRIPAVHLDETGKLRAAPEDKTLRGMPSEEAQAFIDAAMKAATRAYAAIPDKAPTRLDKSNLRRVMQSLADRFLTTGALDTKADVAGLLTDPRTLAAITAICDVTKTRDERMTALAEAITNDDLTEVARLVDEDHDILNQHQGSARQTLLHQALSEGKVDLSILLLEKGANPNAIDHNGNIPVCLSAGLDLDGAAAERLFSALLENDADLSLPGPDGVTAYETAVKKGLPKVLETIIEDGGGEIEDLFVASFAALARQMYDDKDAGPYDDFNTGELKALALARFNTLKGLTRFDDANDVTAILNVDDTSRDAIAELILITKARKQNRIDLKAAITADDAASVARIMAEDPIFATLCISEGKTALDLAAIAGKDGAMAALLAGGADPNNVNDRNRTALHELLFREVGKTNVAKQGEVTATATLLLEAGANPNAQDRLGNTPLHLAGFRNNVAMINKLAERDDIDSTIKDNRGWTAHDKTLGSTNIEAEAALIAHNYGDNDPPVEAGAHSTVDLLCMASLCTDPAKDDPKLRQMYEKLYAVELLRPILDLAAAAACKDRDPPNGGLRIFANDGNTVGPLYGQTIGPSGAYDQKVNTLLVCMTSNNLDGDPLGTLSHELTHLTAHLVTNDLDTVPYTDDLQKQAYIAAIQDDMKRMHLLCADDPSQAFVKKTMSDRMNTYAEQKMGEVDFAGADLRLLQEHVVSVPQLIALYGVEYVRAHVPSLMAFFEDFSARAADTLANDPRFATGRGKIDPVKNLTLTTRLARDNVAPHAPEVHFAPKDNLDFSVDTVLDKLRDEYRANNGTRKIVNGDVGPTIAFSGDDFEITPEQSVALEKRLAALKKVLDKTMSMDKQARYLHPDSLKPLIIELGRIIENPERKDMLSGAVLLSDTWVKKGKIDYIQSRVDLGNPVKVEDIAEVAVLESELRAMGGSSNPDEWVAAALDASNKKQQQAIAMLTEELNKPENRALVDEQPGLLMQILPEAVTGPDSEAIYVKTGRKRFGTRDPHHVSINVGNAQREWVEALLAIPR